jgi:hypothetical protein
VEDWFQILVFLFIFIVLPLLQGLGRKKAPPPQDPAEYEEAVLREEAEGSWSEGWGSWPAEEEVAVEEPEPEPLPLPLPRRVEVPAPWEPVHREERPHDVAARPMPHPAPVPMSVDPRAEVRRVERTAPAAMALHVDRAAEHRRFHERTEVAAAPVRAGRSALLEALHGSDLRKAVILAEVLGPPRSLQPLERNV